MQQMDSWSIWVLNLWRSEISLLMPQPMNLSRPSASSLDLLKILSGNLHAVNKLKQSTDRKKMQ